MAIKHARTGGLGFAILLGACSPEQWLVLISTDAQIPQFGDRLLLEVLTDDGQLACTNCQRSLGVGPDTNWPVSFGIKPEMQPTLGALHVRARLYRADHVTNDGSPQSVFLDGVGRLAMLGSPARVHLPLSLNCFGVASALSTGSFRTCDPQSGLLTPEPVLGEPPGTGPLNPGSWGPGGSSGCRGTVPPDMACVPGGAFVMGNTYSPGVDSTLQPQPERLVIISSFAMDRDEYTAQNLYSLRKSRPDIPLPQLNSSLFLCTTMGDARDADNRLPVACITRDAAAKICDAMGKRLPTEAEWEYAAGNGSEETRFPWGNDADICGHTVVARGLTELELNGLNITNWTDCRIAKDGAPQPWGPLYGGHAGDVSRAGIHNLAGNVAEWVADDPALYTDTCWRGSDRGPNWIANPRCTQPLQGPARSMRGGQWWSYPATAENTRRGRVSPDATAITQGHYGVGFRCVKDL